MAKKQRKGRFQLVLKKDGFKDIEINNCPEKIKLTPWQTFNEVFNGLPAMQVKPIDWKGVGIMLGSFSGGILLLCVFGEMEMLPLALISLLAGLGFCAYYTKNYFFNFIKQKITEGYVPETQEMNEFLLKAGIYNDGTVGTENATSHTMQNTGTKETFPNVAAELEKLASLMEKGILSREEFDEQKKKLLGK